MPDRPLDSRVKPRSKQERLPRTSAIPQVRRRGVRSPVLQPGPLGLRHGLGRRTGAPGVCRALGYRGDRGAPRAGVGLRAGHPSVAERLGTSLQVWRKGDRHGPLAPRRLRHGHGRRLLLPGPVSVPACRGTEQTWFFLEYFECAGLSIGPTVPPSGSHSAH